MVIRTAPPKPVGRPSKFPQIDLVKLEEIARNGYTVAQMADHFKISKRAFNGYRKYPEFREALRRSRAFADQEVEQALFRRAMGYSHPCDVVVYGDQARVVTLMKHQPPSIGAARLWLSNRQPDKWSGRPADELPVEQNPDVDLSRLPEKDREVILEANRLLKEYESRGELIFLPPEEESGRNITTSNRHLRYKKRKGRRSVK
jgi:hypothetical protein